jgi:bacterioferritin
MKGDAKVIDFLNAALRSELTAVSQYWLHYRLQEDWGFGHLADKSRAESIEEMHHADKLIARIIFLEGHPNLQKLDPLRIGQSIRETLDCDLAAEHEARTLYIEARRHCDSVVDYVTRALFDELIVDEEGHIDFLETQIGLFDTLGAEKYCLLNAKPASKADCTPGHRRRVRRTAHRPRHPPAPLLPVCGAGSRASVGRNRFGSLVNARFSPRAQRRKEDQRKTRERSRLRRTNP